MAAATLRDLAPREKDKVARLIHQVLEKEAAARGATEAAQGAAAAHAELGAQNAALAREKELVLGQHTARKGALARFRAAQEERLRRMCAS